MVGRSAVLLGLLGLAVGLQVTPNSPCTSFCIDSNDLDFSDPNSSNTRGSDITCSDAQYNKNSAGQKFQRCLTCLQTSNFVQGKESDQQWFLYNLRYSFDYCIFGFPNATDVGSNPCQTSTACGPLMNALTDGGLDPLKSPGFQYCGVDNNVMTSIFYDKCLACVRASSDHRFTANFLVALEAGCRQLPAPGKLIGLNETVFTKTLVSIIDPTAGADPNAASGSGLPLTTIVAIVVSAVVVILLVAGCGFVQYRKRRARRNRGVNPDWHRGSQSGGHHHHRPQSSLSFRCQTHLTPRSPNFPADHPLQRNLDDIDEKPSPVDHSANSTPVLSRKASSQWQQQPPTQASVLPSYEAKNSRKETIVPLQTITTSLPSQPGRTHSSPTQVRGYVYSPADDYTTPTSSVSAKSTTALLPTIPAYVPAEHAGVPPSSSPPLGAGGPTFTPGPYGRPAPLSGFNNAITSPVNQSPSPKFNQGSWPLPASAGRMSGMRPTPPSPRVVGGFNASGTNTSPVDSRQIQLSFAPPPTQSRR